MPVVPLGLTALTVEAAAMAQAAAVTNKPDAGTGAKWALKEGVHA